MLLADVAVRVLYTSYDSLSPLSKTYHCPVNPTVTASSIAVDNDDDNIEEQEELMNTGEDDNKSVASSQQRPVSRVRCDKNHFVY